MACVRTTFALLAAVLAAAAPSLQAARAMELEKQYTVRGFERFRWELQSEGGEFSIADGACLLRNHANQQLILLSSSRVRDLVLSVEFDFPAHKATWAGILLDYSYFPELESASYSHILVHSDGRMSVGQTVRDSPQNDLSGAFPLDRKHPRHVTLKVSKLRDRMRVVVNGERMDYRLPGSSQLGNFGILLAPGREIALSGLELTIYREPDIPFKGIRYKDLFGDPRSP